MALRKCLTLEEKVGERGWMGTLGTEETLSWAGTVGMGGIRKSPLPNHYKFSWPAASWKCVRGFTNTWCCRVTQLVRLMGLRLWDDPRLSFCCWCIDRGRLRLCVSSGLELRSHWIVTVAGSEGLKDYRLSWLERAGRLWSWHRPPSPEWSGEIQSSTEHNQYTAVSSTLCLPYRH